MFLIYLWSVENVAFSYFGAKKKVSDQARIETQMHHQLQLHNQSPSALLGRGLGSASWNKNKKKRKITFSFPWLQKAAVNSTMHQTSAATTVLKPTGIRTKLAQGSLSFIWNHVEIKSSQIWWWQHLFNFKAACVVTFIIINPILVYVDMSQKNKTIVCTSPVDACGC